MLVGTSERRSAIAGSNNIAVLGAQMRVRRVPSLRDLYHPFDAYPELPSWAFTCQPLRGWILEDFAPPRA